jgi:hypothetical protein
VIKRCSGGWSLAAGLRPIGPGGYSGGECYQAAAELEFASGDFLSDQGCRDDDDSLIAPLRAHPAGP